MTVTPGHKGLNVYLELKHEDFDRLREYAGLLTTHGTAASYVRRAVLEQMRRDGELAERVRATLRGENTPPSK